MHIDSVLPQLEVKKGIDGIGVRAGEDIPAGVVLFVMDGPILKQPTRTSVQIGPMAHIEDIWGGRVNHSCHPTAKVNQGDRTLVSLRAIQKGEEITFDYRENEDKLANPFMCHCCHQFITGKEKG